MLTPEELHERLKPEIERRRKLQALFEVFVDEFVQHLTDYLARAKKLGIPGYAPVKQRAEASARILRVRGQSSASHFCPVGGLLQEGL